MDATFSNDFRLVAATCRWPREEARAQAIAEAASAGVEWPRVVQIAKRHRVEGLVADGLRQADVRPPDEQAEALARRARRIAERNLLAIEETARLGRLLDQAGIAWLSFKGVTLAAEAFGSIGLKASKDIDLLVEPEQAPDVGRILRARGYRRLFPAETLSDDQLHLWHRVSKESAWLSERHGLVVEVHGRLLHNPRLLDCTHALATRRVVEIAPGLAFPTLGRDLMMAYLFAHGAVSGWFRLKWLADVNALLAREDAGGLEQHYRAAQACGVGRCAAQALLLCHALFERPLAQRLRQEIESSRVHRRLVGIATGAMSGRFEACEHPGAPSISLLPVALGNLMLRSEAAFKLSELGSMSANPTDRAAQRLPPAMSFLYPALGGARYLARLLGLLPRSGEPARRAP